jgi:translocation and assembly module TamB
VQDLELKAVMNSAELTWVWRGEEIRGGLALVMAEQGKADADFRLPIPARLPFSVNRSGPLSASVRATLHENGTLSYLFPGLIQESRGRIVLNVRTQGTWEEPKLRGTLGLDGAGAYVPEAGIHITDVSLKARLEQRRLLIDALSAHSGPGSVTAKATIALDERDMLRYEGHMTGERFQAVHLPEMHFLASPDIEFAGAPGKLSVRGEVRVPEFSITGPPKEGPVQPSEDVVVVNGREPRGRASGPDLDARIKVILGDHVTVKVAGVDAQLGGETMLTARSMKEITGVGEITVKKGRYRTYGVDLEITRGTIFFPGGPINDPTLDILALRTAGEVRAGVLVTGTLHEPLIRLYSEPPMPDTEVLAYIVLGHPLGQSRQESDYLIQAAGVLLSAGQSASLQDQLKRRTGLDTIEVQTGEGEVARSLVTVGKYLSPELYVSYGRSLFTGANLFRLRYEFTKNWELETKSGEKSSVDLYYTIQID